MKISGSGAHREGIPELIERVLHFVNHHRHFLRVKQIEAVRVRKFRRSPRRFPRSSKQSEELAEQHFLSLSLSLSLSLRRETSKRYFKFGRARPDSVITAGYPPSPSSRLSCKLGARFGLTPRAIFLLSFPMRALFAAASFVAETRAGK